VWNPPPRPPKWQYRDKTRKFIEDNHQQIGIIALGNSIVFEDIGDLADEYSGNRKEKPEP
jgi:hypothetical protein